MCQEMSKSACENLWRGCTIPSDLFAQKCAERGLKEFSWAEPGRRGGHKKLGRGQGGGGGRWGGACRRNGGGPRERFSVGIGKRGVGGRCEEKGGRDVALDPSSNCVLRSQRAGMWLWVGEKML